jgi:hypothetical protein
MVLPMSRLSPQLREVLKTFDALPDDAVVGTKIAAIILGVSDRTMRSNTKLKGVVVSPNRFGFKVGDIRALVNAP